MWFDRLSSLQTIFEPHRSESFFLWCDIVPFWLVWYIHLPHIHLWNIHLSHTCMTFMIHTYVYSTLHLHLYACTCIQVLRIHILSISSPRFARSSWRAVAEWNSLVSWASIRPVWNQPTKVILIYIDTLPETNSEFTPENGWLEDEFGWPVWEAILVFGSAYRVVAKV